MNRQQVRRQQFSCTSQGCTTCRAYAGKIGQVRIFMVPRQNLRLDAVFFHLFDVQPLFDHALGQLIELFLPLVFAIIMQDPQDEIAAALVHAQAQRVVVVAVLHPHVRSVRQKNRHNLQNKERRLLS